MALQALKSSALALRESLAAVPHTSSFLTTGTLTPEEFAAAGDRLVARYPSWAWRAAERGFERAQHVADKQFLLTTGVPCLGRVADVVESADAAAAAGAGAVADPDAPDAASTRSMLVLVDALTALLEHADAPLREAVRGAARALFAARGGVTPEAMQVSRRREGEEETSQQRANALWLTDGRSLPSTLSTPPKPRALTHPSLPLPHLASPPIPCAERVRPHRQRRRQRRPRRGCGRGRGHGRGRR